MAELSSEENWNPPSDLPWLEAYPFHQSVAGGGSPEDCQRARRPRLGRDHDGRLQPRRAGLAGGRGIAY